jgi:hypothetical protein
VTQRANKRAPPDGMSGGAFAQISTIGLIRIW